MDVLKNYNDKTVKYSFGTSFINLVYYFEFRVHFTECFVNRKMTQLIYSVNYRLHLK